MCYLKTTRDIIYVKKYFKGQRLNRAIIKDMSLKDMSFIKDIIIRLFI